MVKRELVMPSGPPVIEFTQQNNTELVSSPTNLTVGLFGFFSFHQILVSFQLAGKFLKCSYTVGWVIGRFLFPPSAGPRVPEDSVLKQLEDENEGTGWRMAIKIEVVMVASVMDS